jgi:hypothetical protein
MRIGLILTVISLLSVSAEFAVAQPEKTSAPATKMSQRYQDHFDVRVTGVRIAQEWKVFGDMPGGPVAKAKPGERLVIVQFEVRDIRSGKRDNDISFKDFELEDQQAHKHKSLLESTDLREVPFSVPDPGSLKLFRVSGLTFDIQDLAKKLKP